MSRHAIDIAGERFGSWEVLARAPSTTRHARWLCRCDCGREVSVSGTLLRTGQTKSCGKGACNWRWRGEAVGYFGAHHRVIETNGPASLHACVDCGERGREWSYDLTDPNERTQLIGKALIRYSTDVSRYVARCFPCHRRIDAQERSRA